MPCAGIRRVILLVIRTKNAWRRYEVFQGPPSHQLEIHAAWRQLVPSAEFQTPTKVIHGYNYGNSTSISWDMGPLPLCLYNQHDRFRGNQYHLSIKIWYNTMQIHSNLRFTMENCHKMGVCHISIHTQAVSNFHPLRIGCFTCTSSPSHEVFFPPLRCFCSLVPWGEVAVGEVNVILGRCRSWIECLHIGCFPWCSIQEANKTSPDWLRSRSLC